MGMFLKHGIAADDPRLDVREVPTAKQPLRVVLGGAVPYEIAAPLPWELAWCGNRDGDDAMRARLVAGLPAVAPVAVLRPLTIVDAHLGDDAGLIGAALLAQGGVSTFGAG